MDGGRPVPDGTTLPVEGAAADERSLPAFCRRPCPEVARDLLGARLVSTVDSVRTSAVVVETEAYIGPDDPASHARKAVGRTKRNAAMFGPPGTAYVYRSYGIHWCLNVVTGDEGQPTAVLIRALAPLHGQEAMERRRGRETELCSGPGRLGEALGITGVLDGHPLDRPPLTLHPGWKIDGDRIGVSGRIGISRAADWPLRFYLRGHPCVSGAPTS